jgi:hypothetical protein
MVALALVVNFAFQTPEEAATTTTPQYKVFAWNDLGMHCFDSDFSIFCLLPPFNTVHAQVVQKGTLPKLVTANEVTVQYQATLDPLKSINSTSVGKTNFWQYSFDLFGAQPAVDQGLTGTLMPNKTKRTMSFALPNEWTAMGIPITNIDDALKTNPYPMLRVSATPKGTTTAATTLDVVVPVSSEMDCKSCHKSGGVAANQTHTNLGVVLSGNPNLDLQSRENILKVHDARYNTTLWQDRPILCASCHYSRALDLAGSGPPTDLDDLSQVIHTRHGKTLDNQLPTSTNPAIIADTGVTACYKCHPGNQTNCLRSVMASAGVGCQNCHGDLLAVGGTTYPLSVTSLPREPWLELPKCQSCHTGDYVQNIGGGYPRLLAHDPNDPSATPYEAPNSRFAENASTLYRNSKGHGGLACIACHGSPHAEWPAAPAGANDNVTANQLQGHAGVVIECSSCHGTSLGNTLKGPHGMHNVNSASWVKDHKTLVETQGMITCKACHGTDLLGAHLSVTPVARTFTIADGRKISISAGTKIGCTMCHVMPQKPDYPPQ